MLHVLSTEIRDRLVDLIGASADALTRGKVLLVNAILLLLDDGFVHVLPLVVNVVLSLPVVLNIVEPSTVVPRVSMVPAVDILGKA